MRSRVPPQMGADAGPGTMVVAEETDGMPLFTLDSAQATTVSDEEAQDLVTMFSEEEDSISVKAEVRLRQCLP